HGPKYRTGANGRARRCRRRRPETARVARCGWRQTREGRSPTSWASRRTALLATRGHPDMLLLREGGRTDAFNWSYGYPDPYIPRALTFEIDERIGSQGEIVHPLHEGSTVEGLGRLAELEVEAVA